SSDVAGVVLQALILDYVEHGQANGAGHRVAAEGIEILHAVGKGSRDLRRGDDRGHGVTVADRFAEGDDVRDGILDLGCPECFAGATEADLHFVGDSDTAERAHVIEHARQIAWWPDDLTAHTGETLGDKCGQTVAAIAFVALPQYSLGLFRVARAAVRVVGL